MTSTRPYKRQRTQESQSDSEDPSSSLEDSAKPTAEGESEATESDVEEGSEDAEEDDQEDFRVKTRSTEYWFNDGNIVLEAGQKHYRVHRSVLSRSSAVFTNIFSRPLPQAPLDEPIDGCLILRLDDPSEDIETMLDLLYDSTKTSIFKEETSLAILGTTLRLGRKYYLTMFWDQATLFLERIYSPSLVDWNGAKRPIYEKLTDDKEDVVFGILSFAHEYRLKSILPAVYLAMFLEYDLKKMKQCFKERKDTMMLRVDEPTNCLMAREMIYDAMAEFPLSWLHRGTVPTIKCERRDYCTARKHTTLMRAMRRNVQDTIALLVTGWDKTKLGEGLCATCTVVAKRGYDNGRAKVWDLLPEFFGLNDGVWHRPSPCSLQ